MNRSKMAALAAATLVLVAVAAVVVWPLQPSKSTLPSLSEVLDTAPTAITEQLYSADVDNTTGKPLNPLDHSYNVVRDGRLVARYTLSKDHSSEDIFYKEDGIGRAYRKDYYATLPGEDFRRQKGIVFYAADGQTVRSEEWARLDGSIEKIGHLLLDGNYAVSTLFGDGQTAENEKILAPDPYANDFVPKLVQEKRWRSPEEGHTLAFLDVLNDDGTREQTEYDGHEHPIMQKHIGRWGAAGTTVKFFFPGTDKVRLESKTDYRSTEADIYRPDGVLESHLQLTSYSVEPKYYDPTGKFVQFEQTWWRRPEQQDGKEVVRQELWQVVLYGPNGPEGPDDRRRILTWEKGVLKGEVCFPCTENGITYERVFFWYRPDGTLEKVEYVHPSNDPGAQMRTVLHTAKENIRIQISPTWLIPPAVPEELPVPPPDNSRDR